MSPLVFLLAAAIFLLAFLGMALGILLADRKWRSSCEVTTTIMHTRQPDYCCGGTRCGRDVTVEGCSHAGEPHPHEHDDVPPSRE